MTSNNTAPFASLIKTGFFSRIITVFLLTGMAVIAPASAMQWTCIGLDTTDVIAIVCMQNFGDSMVIAGTKHSGVYYKRDAESFKLLTDWGTTAFPPALMNIHLLYTPPNKAISEVFAASDSGLYVYRFTSGVQPRWYKVNDMYPGISAMTGIGDTLFAADPRFIYRSTNTGMTWTKCEHPFGANANPEFSSLAAWNKAVAIGSDEFVGGMLPWVGVGLSRDYGNSWTDISNLPNQEKPLSPVYALCSYTPRYNKPLYLLAATKKGMYQLEYCDTAPSPPWMPFTPQPTANKIRGLYATYESWSEIATIFACSDSGLYTCDFFTAPQWVKSLNMPVHGVTSFVLQDPQEWFAATAQGVYRCTQLTFVNEGRVSAGSACRSLQVKRMVSAGLLRNPLPVAVEAYLPSGKKVATIPPRGTAPCNSPGIYFFRILR